MSEITVLQGGRTSSVDPDVLTELLRARTPAVYFSTLIGDSILTLPTLRALAEMFTAPITLICPKIAFDLCFHAVSPRLIDITGIAPAGPPIGREASRILDYDALVSDIGAVDVFINAVGGVKITEPAADLAVLLAINSSMRNKPLPSGFVVFGEVGLAGEIRPAPRGQERLREAAKLGFSIAMIPKSNAPKQKIEGMTIVAVERIDEAFNKLRELD